MNTLRTIKSVGLIACCVAFLLWSGQLFAAERVVLKDDKTFSELFLKVDSDGVVKFVNHDTVPHILTFKSTKTSMSLRELAPGASQAIKFSTPGLYDVQCQDHPDMKLTMLVSFVDKVVSN